MRKSLRPFAVVVLTQLLLAFNISTLKISIDTIVASYGTTPNAVKSAIIIYSLVVAACIMVGAKVSAALGPRRVFRKTMFLFALAMLAMVLSTDALTMILAQATAGAAAAVLGPTAIMLVAEHYPDVQTKMLGWLSAARSASLIGAFLIAGALATWSDWRLTYVLLLILTLLAYALGEKLDVRSAGAVPALGIDKIGFALLVCAVTLLGFGFGNLSDWGVLRAAPGAPLGALNISPALVLIVCGLLVSKALIVWSRKLRAAGRAPLVSPELVGTPLERAVLLSIFTIGAVSSGVTFLIPLYIEIVQGRNSVYTALALTPFTAASFAAAILVARIPARIALSRVARLAFVLVAAGLMLLGAVIRNDWSDLTVITSLALTGAGEGTLVTLLFKLLAAASPREAAADVDPLCSAMSHLAVGVGTAVAGALVVGLLSASVHRDLALDPAFATTLRAHVDLDKVNFVSNDQLRRALERSNIAPEHVDEAVRINTQARLRALKTSFFALAALALLAVIPCARIHDEDLRTNSRGGRSDDSLRRRDQPLSGPSFPG